MPAVHDFNEKFDQRTANAVQGQKTFTRVYQDEVNQRVSEADEMAYVNSSAVGAPNINVGSPHPDPSGAGTVVTEINCEDDADDGRSWRVTVKWGTPKFGTLSADPLTRPVEFEWSSDTGQEEFAQDYSDSPQEIVNSAGLPFDDRPKHDVAVVSVQMVRNETVAFFRTVVIPLMGFYGYATNKYLVKIDGFNVAASKLRVLIKSAPKITEGATTYYRVTYEFHIRNGAPEFPADGWRERYADRGHYEINDDGDLTPIMDDQGQIIQDAFPLDGSGAAAVSSTSDPVWLGPFLPYKELDLMALNLS